MSAFTCCKLEPGGILWKKNTTGWPEPGRGEFGYDTVVAFTGQIAGGDLTMASLGTLDPGLAQEVGVPRGQPANNAVTPTATATTETGSPTATQGTGWVIPGGGNGNATAAAGGDDGADSGTDGTGSGVTALPSTGQGSDSGASTSLYLLLGLALGFLVGAAPLRRWCTYNAANLSIWC
jgi:hypothetical protein